METKRSNLRFTTITVSLALAGLTATGAALLLSHAETARAQDQSEGQFEPNFEQIPVPDVIPEPPPQPQPPEGFDVGPIEDVERADEGNQPPASAPATAPTSAPAPVIEEPAPVRPTGPPPRGTRVRRGSTRGNAANDTAATSTPADAAASQPATRQIS